MKKISVKQAFVGYRVLSRLSSRIGKLVTERGFTLSPLKARRPGVGRPLTPVSVAGVARRTTRRAVVGGAVVGASAAGLRPRAGERRICLPLKRNHAGRDGAIRVTWASLQRALHARWRIGASTKPIVLRSNCCHHLRQANAGISSMQDFRRALRA